MVASRTNQTKAAAEKAAKAVETMKAKLAELEKTALEKAAIAEAAANAPPAYVLSRSTSPARPDLSFAVVVAALPRMPPLRRSSTLGRFLCIALHHSLTLFSDESDGQPQPPPTTYVSILSSSLQTHVLT